MAGTYPLAIMSSINEGEVVFTPIKYLSSAHAVTLYGRFVYGSGGSQLFANIETSLDSGSTWIPIACFAFTTINSSKAFNLSGLKDQISPIPIGALSGDEAISGILGDWIRARVVADADYVNSTLDLRMTAR